MNEVAYIFNTLESWFDVICVHVCVMSKYIDKHGYAQIVLTKILGFQTLLN